MKHGHRVACVLAMALSCSETSVAAPWLHAVGAGTIGYSDNVLGAPSSAREGDARPIASPYLQLSLGLIATREKERVNFTANYQHLFTYFFAPRDFDSSDALNATGVFELSPRDTLSIGLGATSSAFTQLFLGATNAQGASVERNLGIRTLRLALTEEWSHQWSEEFRSLQSVLLSTITRFDAPIADSGLSATGRLGGEYQFPRDTIGALASFTFLRAEDLRLVNTSAAGSMERGYLVDGVATWRRELFESWSLDVSAGAAAVFRPGMDSDPEPIANVGVGYRSETFEGRASYAHDQVTSLETSSVLKRDEGALSVTGTVSDTYNLRINGGVNLGRYEERGVELTQHGNVWSAQLQLLWDPRPVQLALAFTQHEQFGADPGNITLRNMSRRAVMLTVSGTYPPMRQRPPASEGGM